MRGLVWQLERFSSRSLGLLAACWITIVLVHMNCACVQAQSGIAPRTAEEQQTIDVYRAVNPAVVFIATKSLSYDPYDTFEGVRQTEGSGSGIIIDAQKGYIITNLHVIQDAANIDILLADGVNSAARLVGYDREYDIAVLQLRTIPSQLVSVEFADSSKLEVGQRVLAIGNPFGLSRTLTSGIISSLGRAVRGSNNHLMRGLIQTDAAINPGNSGGALLDLAGRLIGINTAILSQSGDSAGIGFAVPINQIKRVLPELIATGKVLRPSLGWILDDTNQGPMVRWVDANGPAAHAGIQAAYRIVQSAFMRGYVLDYERADLIVAVNGVRVASREDADEQVSACNPEKPIELIVRRGGANGAERKILVKAVLK